MAAGNARRSWKTTCTVQLTDLPTAIIGTRSASSTPGDAGLGSSLIDPVYRARCQTTAAMTPPAMRAARPAMMLIVGQGDKADTTVSPVEFATYVHCAPNGKIDT
ncbi:hypothetical protein GCM10007198_06130 [Microbacterium aerolatum]|uniref:Uncharacterized protein n=1 Tax=Microbacterium aerolatum TaxID=153731 RepID=A0A511AER7_9MICO|nr:hypothetical protein MAE01_17950 [Microbacterium aerolatum]GGB18377.1 hypothetical protein GCM10007198_06130 [Microbacterium aerolatum]